MPGRQFMPRSWRNRERRPASSGCLGPLISSGWAGKSGRARRRLRRSSKGVERTVVRPGISLPCPGSTSRRRTDGLSWPSRLHFTWHHKDASVTVFWLLVRLSDLVQEDPFFENCHDCEELHEDVRPFGGESLVEEISSLRGLGQRIMEEERPSRMKQSSCKLGSWIFYTPTLGM